MNVKISEHDNSPRPKMLKIKKRSRRLFPPCLATRRSRVMSCSKGIYQKDLDGNVHMSWSAQSHNLGYNHQKINLAMIKQLGENTNPFIQIELAEKLLEIAHPSISDGRLFFANTGSDAIEYAIRMSRYCSKKTNLIALQGSFHGSSLGALSLTMSDSEFRMHSQPLLTGVSYLPPPYCYRCFFGRDYPDCDLQCIEHFSYVLDTVTHPNVTAAIFIEPIQTHGGIIVPSKGYFKELRNICDDKEILLIDDEVITGLGRTGQMFGIEHWNTDPDIMIVAKPLASGMPLGAVIGTNKIMEKYDKSCPESTRAGNSIACAAALATINAIIDEKILKNTRMVGKYILKRLNEMSEQHSLIGDIRGKGLLIGVELVKDHISKKPATKKTEKIIRKAYQKGLIISHAGTYKQVLRITPPLIISKEEAENGLEILGNAMKEVEF